MTGNDALLQKVRAAVCELAGSDAQVLGGWLGAPVLPLLPQDALALRGVYAFSATRIAGLRSWRDTVEVEIEHDGRAVHVVMHEASKWARFVLKSHPGPRLWSDGVLVAADDRGDLLERLGALARQSVDAHATRWLAVAGLDQSVPAQPLGPPERFAALEDWLIAVRQAANTPIASGNR